LLEKARGIAVDEVVIDLEDAVVAERKAEARAAAVAALARATSRLAAVSVRINAPGTAWAHDDLIALGGAPRRPASVVVPKVESVRGRSRSSSARSARRKRLPVAGAGGDRPRPARHRRDRDRLVDDPGAGARLRGPGGVGWARSRAGPRTSTSGSLPRMPFLTAARAAGLRAIDGPFLAIDDEDGLRAAAERAADLGSTASG